MFTDITGKKRFKIGLHTHTTRSDGTKSPEETMSIYAAGGYDMLALTDHWVYNPAGKYGDMTILSGCEYDISDCIDGINVTFHIIAIGMDHDPKIDRKYINDHSVSFHKRLRFIVDTIRQCNGIAILAHPAWSLNTPEQIIAAGDFDAVEIYNSVSEVCMSDRPYSGLLVDMLGERGVFMPLLATDDTHYYLGEEMRGMVMAEADAVEKLGLGGAIKASRFYATEGPEIHLEQISDTQVKVTCSPTATVAFHSNLLWTTDRMFRGEDIMEAIYTLKPEVNEKFVRAEITDKNGRAAWSNIITINRL